MTIVVLLDLISLLTLIIFTSSYTRSLDCAHEQKVYGLHALCTEQALSIGVVIVATMKPVFLQIQLIHCAYESLRCLYLKIWRFLCSRY